MGQSSALPPVRFKILWINRYWQKYIAENPLILQQGGIRRDRPWWRSRFGFVLGILILLSALRASEFIWNGARLMGLRGPLDQSVNPVVHSSLASRLQTVEAVLLLLVFLFCLANIAYGWTRDSAPSVREQLAISPLTLDQILGARLYLWMLPLIILFGAVGLGSLLRELLVIAFVPDDSYFWYAAFWAIKPEKSRVALAAARFLTHLPVVSWFGMPILTIGLVTRLTLIRFRWFLSMIATLGLFVGFVFISGLAQRRIDPVLYPRIGPAWGIAVYSLIEDLAVWVMSFAVWRGLRRHVGRRYYFLD